MAEEIAAIYVVGQLTKKELKEQLELTEEQIKIDLRELSRAKLLEQKGKDKKYMLSEMAQIRISSFWNKNVIITNSFLYPACADQDSCQKVCDMMNRVLIH